MERSRDTLDSVADACYRALGERRFMIIPTHAEPMHWRIKRWFPEYYFRKLVKFAAPMRRP